MRKILEFKKATAHIRDDPGDRREQSLEEHSIGVARQAERLGTWIGYPNTCKLYGYLHDLGKLADLFQRKIHGEGNISFNHTLAGMQILKKLVEESANALCWNRIPFWARHLYLCMGAAVISSHHIGLPDMGSVSSYVSDMSETDKAYEVDAIWAAFQKWDCFSDVMACFYKSVDELCRFGTRPGFIAMMNNVNDKVRFFRLSMGIRMFSSILHSADWQDTAEFMYGFQVRQRDPQTLFKLYLEALDKNVRAYPHDTVIGQERQALYEVCYARGDSKPGIYTLSGPGGVGKTKSSMAFALRHALRYNKRRIIVVIPYLTITTQNAQSIREAFGCPDEMLCILERHSAFEVREDLWDGYSEEERHQMELSLKNLDAPIVFTTTVQLENALFGGSYSDYHTMQALADSVIIMDEVQMIDLKKYHPVILAMNELKRAYNTTILLCTATLPDFVKNPDYPLDLSQNHELVPDVERLRRVFDRVIVENLVPHQLHTPDTISRQVLRYMSDNQLPNAILIVNKKATSEECESILRALDPELKVIRFNAHGKIFSKRIVEEIQQNIRDSKAGLCRFVLVATSIVEMGVDISFATGFRELTALPSLEQSSCRVNRSGEYAEKAVFHIFSMASGFQQNLDLQNPYYEMTLKIQETKNLIGKMTGGVPSSEFFSPSVYQAYYQNIEKKNTGHNGYMDYLLQTGGFPTLLAALNAPMARIPGCDLNASILTSGFRTAYGSFQSIDAQTWLALCPTTEGKQIIQDLEAGVPYKLLDRRIVRNSVALNHTELAALQKEGVIRELGKFIILDECKLDRYGLHMT